MLEHEAQKDVVERAGGVGEIEDIRLLERYVGKPCRGDRMAGLGKRCGGRVDSP
jgi:hypothetical protein